MDYFYIKSELEFSFFNKYQIRPSMLSNFYSFIVPKCGHKFEKNLPLERTFTTRLMGQ